CEALTRQPPSSLHAGEMSLPQELPPAFRGVVTRCLNHREKERPSVNELQVWARGAQLVASLSVTATHRPIRVTASDDGAIEVIGDSDHHPPLQAAGGIQGSAPGFSK